MNCRESDVCTKGKTKAESHSHADMVRPKSSLHARRHHGHRDTKYNVFFHLYKYTEMGKSESFKLFINTD